MERDEMVHRRRHQGLFREYRSPPPDEHPSKKYPRQPLPAVDRRSPQGDMERVRGLQKEMRKHHSKPKDDPGYRRLRYIRYADDFLFGFAGPFEESHQIKDKVASFLQTELKLPLSAEKTLI